MSDLLFPLLTVVETVRQRIKLARSGQGWNEAQTRASLIDPILTAVGWDTADPLLVRHELKSSGGRADYTLRESEDHLVAIVEAKSIGDLLGTKDVGQTTNYANHLGVPYAVLTNGDRWVLYDVFQQAKIEDRLLLDVTVSSAEPQAVALDLLRLWRPRISSKRPPKAQSVTEPPNTTPKPVAVRPPPPPEADWVPLDMIQPDGQHLPLAIRFEDGFEWSTAKWWSVLEGAIVWLYQRRALTETGLPLMDQAGKRPVVHLQSEAASVYLPKPARDTPFVLSSHGNAPMLLERFKRLLSACGHSPASVLAKPRQ